MLNVIYIILLIHYQRDEMLFYITMQFSEYVVNDSCENIIPTNRGRETFTWSDQCVLKKERFNLHIIIYLGYNQLLFIQRHF